jgi:hypothetical protein
VTPTPENVALVVRAAQLGVDPSRQGWRVELLERLKEVAEDAGHPLTPWFALRWARDHSLPQPDWVLDYFYERGRHVNSVVSSPTPGVSEAEAVGRVLGFCSEGRGKPAPGAEALRQSEHWLYAYELEVERQAAEERGEAFKLEAGIAAVVARNNTSASTVRRASDVYGATVIAQVKLLREVFSQE